MSEYCNIVQCYKEFGMEELVKRPKDRRPMPGNNSLDVSGVKHGLSSYHVLSF